MTARVSKLQIAERESEEQREWERPESGNEQRAELLRPERERRPTSGRESEREKERRPVSERERHGQRAEKRETAGEREKERRPASGREIERLTG
jgi:hypothetical protein